MCWNGTVTGERETIFYDGHCGLCHGFVRFVAHRDRAGLFEFAPLGGSRFAELVAPEQRAGIPDSVVVRTQAGELLVRSAGVLHVLRRLGGMWRALAGLSSIFPAGFRDVIYDFIARTRKKIFATPTDVCPIVPPELRSRFNR